MIQLSRESILGSGKPAPEPVDVPEWGGQVYVRHISGRERDRFEGLMTEAAGTDRWDNIRARFVAMVVCDMGGNPLFTEADVPALGELLATALDRIFDKGRAINGMTADAVEDVKKNSVATPAAASP